MNIYSKTGNLLTSLEVDSLIGADLRDADLSGADQISTIGK